LPRVVERTEYEAPDVADADAPLADDAPGTTAVLATARFAVAPFGVVIGAPPSTAWAGAAANAATRLASKGNTACETARRVISDPASPLLN
jgi:hypothetical protein